MICDLRFSTSVRNDGSRCRTKDVLKLERSTQCALMDLLQVRNVCMTHCITNLALVPQQVICSAEVCDVSKAVGKKTNSPLELIRSASGA